ncbi:MAG TPA: ABC transporter permease, partial [Thermoanaerobaculia bacterium]|nr:ABC transporter permease [Thermoanaerobaculia bacterium]
MIAPRWRKVLRDIGETPLRTALAVVAMAAGVFGLGTILTSYSILTRELAKTYADTNPSSAIVSGTRAPNNAIEVEPRPLVRARVRIGNDEWAPLYLYVVRDFNDIHIDKIRRDTGAWPPRNDEVLLERTALSVARAHIGDRVTMRTPDGVERTLRVAGTVHAAGQAPAWMDHVVIGFVSWNSIARINEMPQLRVVTRGARLRHPHADQMDTFLFLLGAFGALTLVLSAVLVANMIHALLAEQVRQVGVMKAIGATTRQIIALYLGQVSILAILALALGVPLGMS